jgi:hypothetical protein
MGEKRQPPVGAGGVEEIVPGNDLLSHTLSRAVPSALRGLTAVFGMGTGVSPSLMSPGNSKSLKELFQLDRVRAIGFAVRE